MGKANNAFRGWKMFKNGVRFVHLIFIVKVNLECSHPAQNKFRCFTLLIVKLPNFDVYWAHRPNTECNANLTGL
jgi:hypothetical protein